MFSRVSVCPQGRHACHACSQACTPPGHACPPLWPHTHTPWQILRSALNERTVCILLQCILVLKFSQILLSKEQLKYFLINNNNKTIYASVRSESSSCRVFRKWIKSLIPYTECNHIYNFE